MQNQSKMTKRQALLALLAAVPVLSYGRQPNPKALKPTGRRLDVDVDKSISQFALLELNLTTNQLGQPALLFLKITVDGKEEVKVSVAEAIQILKGVA